MNIPQTRVTPRSNTDIRELLSRVSLTALVERYSGTGRQSGNTVTYQCPNPAHPDRSPSFTVQSTLRGERAKCWSACDFYGDALDFVKWQEGLETAEALKWLRSYIGDPTRPAEPKRFIELARREYPQLSEQPERLDPDTEARILTPYLRSRAWPSSVVEQFELSVVIDNYGRYRIRHPYHQPKPSGEYLITWWQDRATDTSTPKWLAAKGRPSIPYNLKALEADSIDTVVICEGAADTITATLALQSSQGIAAIGVPGSNAWRKEYAALLTDKNVIIAVDNDEAGKHLESAIQDKTPRALSVVRFSNGDLTDTAKQSGIDAVSELLLSKRATTHVAPTTQSQALALILRAFPEAVTL